jgi:hypothetical protein
MKVRVESYYAVQAVDYAGHVMSTSPVTTSR